LIKYIFLFSDASLRCAWACGARKVAVRDLYGTTLQPLLATLVSGKTLKSCPDTCLRADANRAISEITCGTANAVDPTFAKAAKRTGYP
jgi:hypothetical protein